jgi:hypothetical protein
MDLLSPGIHGDSAMKQSQTTMSTDTTPEVAARKQQEHESRICELMYDLEIMYEALVEIAGTPTCSEGEKKFAKRAAQALKEIGKNHEAKENR